MASIHERIYLMHIKQMIKPIKTQITLKDLEGIKTGFLDFFLFSFSNAVKDISNTSSKRTAAKHKTLNMKFNPANATLLSLLLLSVSKKEVNISFKIPLEIIEKISNPKSNNSYKKPPIRKITPAENRIIFFILPCFIGIVPLDNILDKV